MHKFAQAVTLGLARLTFASLHGFEQLGVNMATIDQAIADWTAYAQTLKAANDSAQESLVAAQTEIQRLKDEDAASDASQISDAVAASNETVAQKLEDALSALRDAPAAPDEPQEPAGPVVSDNPEPGLSGDQDNVNPGVPGDLPNEFPATADDETTPPPEAGPGTTGE